MEKMIKTYKAVLLLKYWQLFYKYVQNTGKWGQLLKLTDHG